MIITPDFCYQSLNVGLCFTLWDILEGSGIVLAIYYIFLKKPHNESSH
jgi:hypothetical protein